MELVKTEHLLVEHFAGPGRIAAFTFSPAGSKTTEGTGFGGAWLLKNGFDVIAFKSDRDYWFQDVTPEHLQHVSDSIPIAERVGYGSSMGGYAALAFAGQLRLNRVFAISPQFDPRGDGRWPTSDVIPFRHSLTQAQAECFVAYDPRNKDASQMARLRQVINLNEIRLPFAGHPVGRFLQETAMLQDMSLSVLRDGAVLAINRKARVKSATYWSNLAAAASRRKRPEMATRFLEQALSLDDSLRSRLPDALQRRLMASPS